MPARFDAPEWTNPLIPAPFCRMSRRSLLVGAAVLALPARAAIAQTPEGATPASDAEGDPDAVALLTDAAAALAAAKTFGFELSVTKGSMTFMEGFELNGVTGVVRRPADFQADVDVGVPFGSITLTAVGLNGTFWIQDPLNDGEWITVEGQADLLNQVNPDMLLQQSIRFLHNAKIDGTDSIDDQDVTIVSGTVNLDAVYAQAGANSDLEGIVEKGDKDVTFAINEAKLPVRVTLAGKIFSTESDDVERQIDLTDYDKPVEIEQPT